MSARKVLLLLGCGILSCLNLWVWQDVMRFTTAPDVRAFFFDVGQGDAELIESKDGRHILIDGGPSSAILTRLGNVLPFGSNTIDAVIISHPHADHISGLIDVVDRYNVGVVFESGAHYVSSESRALEEAIDKKHIPRVYVDRPMTITFGNSIHVALVAPDHSFVNSDIKHIHDAMVVGVLEYQGAHIAFMGDAEQRLEQKLIGERMFTQVDILKVGHHGSKTSSSESFLSVIRPRVAIVSVGRNKYGHPNEGVLERLNTFGTHIFRTDENGTIEARFFSSQIFLSAGRGVHQGVWERIR